MDERSRSVITLHPIWWKSRRGVEGDDTVDLFRTLRRVMSREGHFRYWMHTLVDWL